MSSQRHIIKRQILDLQVSSKMGALALQNRISTIYRNKLLPLIEAYCDRLSSPDQIHRIDRLVIDLGEIEITHLETDFVQKLEAALAQELTNQIPTSTPPQNKPSPPTAQSESVTPSPAAALEKSRSPQPAVEQAQHPTPYNPNSPSAQPQPITPLDADLELLSCFLQTGRLPWWSESLTPQQLETRLLQLLQSAPQRASTILQTHLRSPQGRQRLLYQFSESLWQAVLKLLAPSWSTGVKQYSTDLQILLPHVPALQTWTSPHFQQTLWQGILLHLSLETPSQSSPDVALTNNLLHLATQANVEPATLITQLQQAIATIAQSKPLPQASPLAKILAQWPKTPLPSESQTSTIADIQATAEQDIVAMQNSSTSEPISPESELATSALETPALDNTQGAIADIEITPDSTITAPQPLTPDKTDSGEEEQSKIAAIQEERRNRGASIPLDSIASPSPELVTDAIAEIEQPLPENPAERLTPDLAPTPTAISAQSKSAIADAPLSQIQHSSTPYFPPTPNAEIYIQNAGLVLFWPFLTHWFTTLGLVAANQFITLDANHHAILLLQYLVDSSLTSSEAQLSLNKLLCGVNLEDSLPTTLELLEPEAQEADALLTAVIHHWSALGNISSNGLQQSFLQRNGLLTFAHDHYLLQVEQKTHDILLDRLPWSIKIIKLPWMERVLHVEWC